MTHDHFGFEEVPIEPGPGKANGGGPGPGGKGNGKDKAAEPYILEGPEDFAALHRPKFAIPGLISDGGTFLLYSPSGHYKTTLIVLAFVLAANGIGLDGSAIPPVPVIIVANEDAFGVKLRLRAAAQHLGLSLDNVRVLASGDFKLDLPECRARLIATAKGCFPGRRPALVIDHYDVSMTGNPTDPEVGAMARDGLREMLASNLFCCATLLAHTPWATTDRAKLPVSLWANMDGRASLEKRADGTATLKVEHVKNGESGYALDVLLRKVMVELVDGPFETVAVEIAKGPDGKPQRSVAKARKERELSDDQRTAVQAISRAIVESPTTPPAAEDNPRGPATTEDAAVTMIARLVPLTTRAGKKRKPFAQREHAARLLRGLHGRYFVRIVAGHVWLDAKAKTGAEP